MRDGRQEGHVVGTRKRLALSAEYTPLRDQVREVVRERIVEGGYPPGMRIVERDLAEELGVSRLPVREALRMLEREGFVSVVPRRGVIVRELTPHDVDQLFDVREALEVLVVRRVTEGATKADLLRLRQVLARARKAIANGNVAGIGQANGDFHDELIRIARNDLLADMLEPLQGRIHWLLRQHHDPAELVVEHADLYEAIASGDPDRAAARAMRHVQVNRDIATRLLFGAATGRTPATG
ncbi:GntR family transcriptional regulator [Streptomyces sp. NPDC046821]|uniref:GntR family transcriptional regulator n=1 Tax=Streptomyces sp. NPDC046821 TaxID=3154702 RepID=UPI00340AE097